MERCRGGRGWAGRGACRLLSAMLGWLFLVISVLLMLSALYAMVQSLRAEPPRKGRAAWEAMWVVLMGLLVLWNLRALGIIQLPPP